MQSAARLAVAVEKDKKACTALVTGLRHGGVARVQHRATPETARALIDTGEPLRLLAIGLDDPALAALELIRDCRKRFPDSVILAIDHVPGAETAADAFRAGADDVLRAPYPESELVARLARRLGQAIPARSILGTISEINFTPVEARIVQVLIAHAGDLVTRNELAKAIDNADWAYGDRKFDVHITKIRRKLRSALGDRMTVRTIRAEGYCLETRDARQAHEARSAARASSTGGQLPGSG
jgi:DNA-binding response OmpR family regulator